MEMWRGSLVILRQKTALVRCLVLVSSAGVAAVSVWGHHSAYTSASGKRSAPRNSVSFAESVHKAEVGNRNRYITEITGEVAFWDGRLGLLATLPYEYYQQTDRADAARTGRLRLGARAIVINAQAAGVEWRAIVRSQVALAASGDRGRFVEEPFSDAEFGVALLARRKRAFVYGELAGFVPVGGLGENPTAQQQYPWEPAEETVGADTHTLKKTTAVDVGLGYSLSTDFAATLGVYYREPYGGILQEHASSDILPGRYREWRAGLEWQMTERLQLTVGYGRPAVKFREPGLADHAARVQRGLPLEQRREDRLRLYKEMYTFSARWLF